MSASSELPRVRFLNRGDRGTIKGLMYIHIATASASIASKAIASIAVVIVVTSVIIAVVVVVVVALVVVVLAAAVTTATHVLALDGADHCVRSLCC